MVTFANLGSVRLPKFVGLRVRKIRRIQCVSCLSTTVSQLFKPQLKKIVVLRTHAFIFCLPWGRPCGNHAIRCINEKTIQCLPNPSQHLPIYLQQFSSYSNRKQKNRRFHVPQPIFLFPLETPLWQSRNMLHGWKDNNQCLPHPSQHVPIYLQQFPSYSNRKCKKSPFLRTAAYIFVSPGDAPATIKHGKTIQCLPNPSQRVPIYLQQFPSCMMLKSMRKSKNRYFLPHFCFPWGRPWGNHAKCCMDGKRIRCLQIVSLHVTI